MRKLSYETVYEEIRSRISEGVWASGDQIPTVPQLAAELNVGISSVREAIRILGKQKILRMEQGRGTFVMSIDSSESPWERFDFLEKATLIQLTEARLILEPELAALAAEKATFEEAELIMKAARAMREKAKKGRDYLRVDMEFHDLIAKAAKNEIIYNMILMINDLLVDSRRKSMKLKMPSEKASYYHVLIAEAIQQKNPYQAKTLMHSHIYDLIHELKKGEMSNNPGIIENAALS